MRPHLLPLFLLSALLAGPTRAVDGNAVIRAPAGGSEIVIRTTDRLAGAIDSITWAGREFIDSVDHGRQLQSACSFDPSTTANAECYNPTEAGSRRDGAGPTSTSRLLELRAEGRLLHTRTQMAYWLAPGERSDGLLARNTNLLSDVVLTKWVHIGTARWAQALDYRVRFTVPAEPVHRLGQFEALTGYLPAAFDTFWQLDPKTRRLVPLSDGPGEINHPVALATADGRHAMGIYAPPQPRPGQSGPRYGRWRFGPERVVKWNCVFRVREPAGLAAGNYDYRMLVFIGTKDEVERMLADPEPPASGQSPAGSPDGSAPGPAHRPAGG